MPRVAEVKTEFTADGAKAQVAIRQLEASVDRLSTKVEKDLSKKLEKIFSVGAVLGFAHAIDAAVERMAALVEQLRKGEKTLNDIKEASPGVSKDNLAFAENYSRTSKEIGMTRDNVETSFARAALLVMRPLTYPLEMMSDRFSRLMLSAQFGDLGEVGLAEAQGRRTKQSAKKDDPETKDKRSSDKLERVNEFKASFSNLQRVGAFAYESDGLMRIQQQSLNQLIAIRQLIASGRFQTAQVNDSIFPQ